jgi:asparagine synthase (glutamine-hydrolysing)
LDHRFHAPSATDPRQAQLSWFAQAANLDFFSRMQKVDVEVYLPDDILTKVDKASMFTSLEARAPLLDYRLAEYVASLPVSVRNPRHQKKYLLKLAMRDLLPEETVERRKMGFWLPVDRWLRGPLREFTWDIVTSERSAQRGVLDPQQARRLLEVHQARGSSNNGATIWALLCFELWCRTYLDSDGLSSASNSVTSQPAIASRPT